MQNPSITLGVYVDSIPSMLVLEVPSHLRPPHALDLDLIDRIGLKRDSWDLVEVDLHRANRPPRLLQQQLGGRIEDSTYPVLGL